MVNRYLHYFLIILTFSCGSISFGQKFGFIELLEKSPDELTVFCIPNNEKNTDLLIRESINIKFKSENWIFINASPAWVQMHITDKSLTDYYFEYAPPSVLADTARALHFVDQVHSGDAPLESSYTGANVIFGIVDQGLDHNHEDFIDSNGNTRVLRYWDQTMIAGPNFPQPYGYGNVWDSTEINAGLCTSNEEASAHGTSVTGIGAGDGSANGTNKGMAPGANLIIVESNFNVSNWTLTVADAVDYIFKVADTLGMPAVVNLSLGTYFGSHDGNDPAGEYIEALLDEKPGRIVVSAAGNAGAKGSFHAQHSPTADTNFVWLLNNPVAAIAPNTIFFDLWSDVSDATFDFALGADTPSPGYDFRGSTDFHGAMSSIGVPILDTIWNGTNRIATFQVYTEIVGANYHMQMFVNNVDSTSYLYRFMTTGSGKYDFWSGAWIGYNNLVTNIPTPAEMPDIIYYNMPDSTQTIVSSWNCSEKVVSVGNMRNRVGHIDNNGNPYLPADTTPPGKLSPNSSKGPTRHGVIKPDVAASGDVTLGSGPLWVLANPAYNALIDSGGMHVRNGGTSMASPVVSGIAALYLERCGSTNYQGFLDDLHASAYTDGYTGAVPNNWYGYGKPHAHNLLQELSLATQPVISNGGAFQLISTASSGYQWYLDGNELVGETSQNLTISAPFGSYEVVITNADGCSAWSAPFVITVGLDELANEGLLVYPNPAKSEFTIHSESEIRSVQMTDLGGKVMTPEKIGKNQYSLESVPNGIYMLTIVTDERIFYSKIVRL